MTSKYRFALLSSEDKVIGNTSSFSRATALDDIRKLQKVLHGTIYEMIEI